MSVRRTVVEVGHLLWLQTRLMRSSLRSGGRQDILRIVGYGLLLLLLVPGVLILNALLVWIYRSLDPLAAAEIIAVIFSFIILFWLLAPVSNTQLVEPFSLPKLFQQPISLGGLIVGGLVVIVFSVGFLSSVPFALAAAIGMSRSALSVLPVLLSVILFLASIVLIKALIDDVFDLIAEDRRLRMLAILLALMPIVVIYGGQLYLQSSFMTGAAPEGVEIDSVAGLSRSIVGLNPSGYLTWQPGGWTGRALGAAAVGRFGEWAIWTGVLIAFVGVAYGAHYVLLRRLYFGELVRVQGQRRADVDRLYLTGPRLPLVSAYRSGVFWALLRADWQGFVRNPYTVRMAITPVILVLMALFLSNTAPAPGWAMGAFAGAMSVLILTLSYGHNILAIMDNPGLGTMLLAPVKARHLLLSHNLVLTVVVLLLSGVVGIFLAIVNGDWRALPVAEAMALGCQLPMLAACNLTAVYLPYRIDLEKGRAAANEARASTLAVLAVMAASAILILPALGMVFIPLLAWQAAVIPGLIAAFVYVSLVYAGGFTLASRRIERRGDAVLAALADTA